jgi:hypothetical protein
MSRLDFRGLSEGLVVVFRTPAAGLLLNVEHAVQAWTLGVGEVPTARIARAIVRLERRTTRTALVDFHSPLP